jgi:hypothetical protein
MSFRSISRRFAFPAKKEILAEVVTIAVDWFIRDNQDNFDLLICVCVVEEN